MAKEVTPRDISNFCRSIAAGIDAARSPRPELVASDIRCAVAALNGNEGAIARVHAVIAAASPPPPAAPKAEPINLAFKGQLDSLQRAAAEIEKRRPGLKGKKLSFTLSAKIEE